MNRSWLNSQLFFATGKQSIRIAGSPLQRILRIVLVLALALALCGMFYRTSKKTGTLPSKNVSGASSSFIPDDGALPESDKDLSLPDQNAAEQNSSDPKSLLNQPMLPGTQPLLQEPAQIPVYPAAAAIHLLGFRRNDSSSREEVSSWQFSPAAMEQVQTHYENAAKTAGFTARKPNSKANQISLIFRRNASTASTTAPAAPGNGATAEQWLIIRIAASESRPDMIRVTLWLRSSAGGERLR